MRKKYADRDEVRRCTVAVPVNEAEKAQIKAAAQRCGMQMAPYCRYVVLRAIQEQEGI